jgi:hypothetical protein
MLGGEGKRVNKMGSRRRLIRHGAGFPSGVAGRAAVC